MQCQGTGISTHQVLFIAPPGPYADCYAKTFKINEQCYGSYTGNIVPLFLTVIYYSQLSVLLDAYTLFWCFNSRQDYPVCWNLPVITLLTMLCGYQGLVGESILQARKQCGRSRYETLTCTHFIDTDTEYNIQIRAEIRYSPRNSFVYGNFSDSVSFRTNTTSKSQNCK